ncbi:MAG TPA: hypothetical protein VK675_01740 [Candidatus Paceibacterota bacterium]|nr:hypothetical protein [Candidatus Paceibacterota bacterium]
MNIKNKFVLKSAIITVLPIIWIIPMIGNVFYTIPIEFLTKFLNLPYNTFSNTDITTIPNFKGWMILVPFWLIVGWLNGLLCYKIRAKYAVKNNVPLELGTFRDFITILLMQFFVASLFLPLALIFHIS